MSSVPISTSKNFVPAVYNGFVDAIGNTPLIYLKAASERTGCQIYGKAEFLNPGGSVKDRAAKSLIEGLERDGKVKPGGTIVEGTAGNTGIGLSYVANAKGYRSVIVIPRTQTQEKKDTLRQAGATLIEVDAKPYANPNNYIKLSGRLAEHIPNACWANQVRLNVWVCNMLSLSLIQSIAPPLLSSLTMSTTDAPTTRRRLRKSSGNCPM